VDGLHVGGDSLAVGGAVGVGAHKKHNPKRNIFGWPKRDGRLAWTYRLGVGAFSDGYATRQAAALAARQEANRAGYERRRELAAARQKAEDARKEAEKAERHHLAAAPLVGALVAGMARLSGRLGQRGQGHGAIYGPIRRGSRQRTKAGQKGRR
jgi:pyruvate/2-oxoglutarate dehydrogenase complex dihydrolipoamide acyltransferase (E2) component